MNRCYFIRIRCVLAMIAVVLCVLFIKVAAVYAYDAPLVTTTAENGKIYKDRADLAFYMASPAGGMYIYYRCYFTDTNGNSVCIEDNLTKYEGNEVNITKNYTVEGIYDISFYCKDICGAQSEIKSLSIAVDSSAPVIEFSGIAGDGIYKSGIDVGIEVREMFYDLMTVVIDGTVTYNGQENKLTIPYDVQAPVNKNIYKLEGSGKYELNVTATDISGHIARKKLNFSIDEDAPEINVINNGERLLSKAIVSNSPDFTIEINDEISGDVSAEIVLAMKSGNTYTTINSYSLENEPGLKKKISLGAEGFYTLKIGAVDKAGNKTERLVDITLDKSPPVIEYLSRFNEKYLNSFVMPENFKVYIKDLTDTVYKMYLNSKSFSGGEVKADGKYILQVLAEDEAGNCSEEMIAFIIDNINPKIVVNGIDSDGNVQDNVIRLSLLDSDDYFESIKINGELIPFDNERKELTIDCSMYESYEVEVTARDLAGNETVETFKAKKALGPMGNDVLRKDVKTLTKNNAKNLGLLAVINSGAGFWIFCGIALVTAVIFLVFALFDIKNISC